MRISASIWRRIGAAALGFALVAGSVSCTGTDLESASGEAAEGGGATDPTADAGTDETAAVTVADGDLWLFDSSVVHDIDIQFDTGAYDEMIEIYETTGEKEWIETTVTIDGTTIDNVGLRLKGNSSLFGLTSETAGSPEDLPWLIRFDKFVDDQLYQGHGDLVIRSNSTETALNEATALELLGLTGLATEEAIATEFSVNGGDAELRLAVELPDDEIWVDTNFDSDDSLLYKADSEGDYSYRGDDPDAYTDIFDQKIGDDDLDPLIDFLEFINTADDVTFGEELGTWLDVDAFATYLAYQDLVGNADDIDGRGNNSYLHYDGDSDRFTVVNWDLNLAFDTANVTGGAGRNGGAVDGGTGRPQRPGGGTTDPGASTQLAGPADQGPRAGGSNVLAERFRSNAAFSQLVVDASAELADTLYDSGAADEILDTWLELLTTEATDLVDPATVEAEAEAIRFWIQSV